MEMCCGCVAAGGETGGEMVAKEGQEKFVEFSGGDGKMGISEFEAFYNEYFAVSNSLAQIMQSSSSAQEMFNMYDTDGDGILWPNHFGELWDNLDNGDEGEDEYGDDGEDEYGDDGEDEYGDDDGTVEAWEQEFCDWKGDDDVMSFEEFQAWYATKCADCPLAM